MKGGCVNRVGAVMSLSKRIVMAVALAGLGILALAAEPSRSTMIERLFDVREFRELAISPDGKWVAYIFEDEVWRVAVGGGIPEKVAVSQENLWGIAWSPTGSWLTYVADDKEGRSQVWALPSGMGDWRAITRLSAGNVIEYEWSPDGKRLAVRINEPAEGLVVPAKAKSYTGNPIVPANAKSYTGHPISLEFKHTDLRDVFLKFSEISGLSFVLDPDVNGRVTARFVELPWDEAVEQLFKTHGLGFDKNGSVVRIARLSTLLEEESSSKATSARSPIVIRGLHYKREGVGRLKPTRTRLALVEVASGGEQDIDIGDLAGASDLAWSPDGTLLAFRERVLSIPVQI